MITQSQVSQALDQALENGYPIDQWQINFVVEDLMTYAKEFESTSASDLVPLIEQWKASRQAFYREVDG